ncbi:MAG: Protein translocase subunit SecF [Candidatus Jorgensenbacteria bacterium GW2011_GWA1_48_11]|uniref:Protein-export membrane protein SecF n=1 Tax=Candidatus Jorgensenbacteria bacterium GW2011_GWA1_48_11 TaxID=1618660 RepID=A0A0G1U9W6_9BACT|nr:MAG: Protein translocase subunit SecF [Candidatus Jorgensenbacteria bacterium GW2011_GWA1_48_11]KKW12303.1 MAG: Protein translocase subunit SecF [Candidatus Jorgensenbacteria bacterium GW2011_GWB1_49_9]
MMDVIGKRKYYLGFAVLVVILSWVLILTLGLREGIDLKGGTQWQIFFPNQNFSEDQVNEALAKAGNVSDVSIKQSSDGSFIVRLPSLSEDQHQGYLTALKTLGNVEEKSFASIGPTIGAELRTKAIWAIGLVILGISLYIAFAFRKVSEPVKSWKYGVITLVTLFHDVSIPSGLLAVLGYFKGIEIDTNFIVALLVVMGFSVHDTIVVFDRIRENLMLNRGRTINLGQIINFSVKETLARSINTSLTLFLVLIALLMVGPSSLFYFILTILVGTIFGTYSSIFVASPLLYLSQKRRV